MDEVDVKPEAEQADRVAEEVAVPAESVEPAVAAPEPEDGEPGETAVVTPEGDEQPAEAAATEPGQETPALAPEASAAVETEAPPAEPEPEAAAEAGAAEPAPAVEIDEALLKAMIEAIVYVAEEPATAAQLANALKAPEDVVKRVLEALVSEYSDPAHGVMIRELAGGYKMATKPEHHEAVRAFAKSLKPALKLSLPALETLATIAYKQPITAPEVSEIRGVQGTGVLKTLLDRKLIQAGGRKNVIGRPILYRTTKEFLLQFGLKDLSELPTLKEFEELRRLAMSEDDSTAAEAPQAEAAATPAENVETPETSEPASSEETAPEPASEAEAAPPAEEVPEAVSPVAEESTPATDVAPEEIVEKAENA